MSAARTEPPTAGEAVARFRAAAHAQFWAKEADKDAARERLQIAAFEVCAAGVMGAPPFPESDAELRTVWAAAFCEGWIARDREARR